MRILLLCTSFNSLTQRLHVVLRELGHTVSVEFDINDTASIEAVGLFRPELVVTPFLRRRIPEAVYGRVPTMVVHPGPPGDRGPNALDWAILNHKAKWGVTVLEAEAELDAGGVWAHRSFAMRPATKSSLYRTEIGDAAVEAVLEAIERFSAGERPIPARELTGQEGIWRPAVEPLLRRVDWASDDTATILRKVRSADGQPGAEAHLWGQPFRLFDAFEEPALATGLAQPGDVVGYRDNAILVATQDGGVWIGALKPETVSGERPFKRPATLVHQAVETPLLPPEQFGGYQPIRYREEGAVGFLSFDFHNGAMDVGACVRLRQAFETAAARPTRVLVLQGGSEFWGNGIHLGAIEAADSAADASLANIEAMDDLAEAILRTTDKMTISALRANAGAGGFFLALASDLVVARDGVVLNPHYKNMGNLYGSEYWTYVLPRRVGAGNIDDVMAARLPMGTCEARSLGLLDGVLSGNRKTFARELSEFARRLSQDGALDARLADKARTRAHDEAQKPLRQYRDEELTRMRRNFYGFDPSYHIARYNFITKVPLSHTPRHLAIHRA